MFQTVIKETVDLVELIKGASKRQALANSRNNRAIRYNNAIKYSEEKRKEETLKDISID